MRKHLTFVCLLALVLGGVADIHSSRSSLAAAPAAQNGAAGSINCGLTGYKAAPGLTAAVAGGALTLTWDGDKNQEVRLRFAINDGTPTIQELAVRRKGGSWGPIAANVTPEFRIVAGKRRMDNQQANGLRLAGDITAPGFADVTPQIIDQYKWDAFWDGPTFLDEKNLNRATGLPRKPEEITRATATYRASSCEVKTDGARLIVTFPGVSLGIFAGQLQYTVYKGANLIQQEVIAKTQQDNVAYLYNSGLKGLAITPASRIMWRDPTNVRQDYQFGGAASSGGETPVRSADRLIVAERGPAGSIAAFPPPHTFFWTRETNRNLGYSWYRKDSDATFSFGIRQSEQEEEENYKGNYPLYNARPNTEQHMQAFFYVSADAAEPTREAVLAYTHGDHYKPVDGYKVMTHHMHTDFGLRLMATGNPAAEIDDLRPLKALGINIVSIVDQTGAETTARRTDEEMLTLRRFQIEGARSHSDKDFLVMISQEFEPSSFGGHTDVLFAHPVYWLYRRAEGQSLVFDQAPYGKVYRVGSPEDLLEMAKRENAIFSMPHPNTKTNAGFPGGFFKKPNVLAAFKDARFDSYGYRWGMGIDRSERRWSEIRVLNLWDKTLNQFADDAAPAKHLLAISEAHHQDYMSDIYGFNPITYVKLASVPTVDDSSSVIKTLMDGDTFVSSGEILMPSYAVQGSGNARKIVADLEWTFPLDFVEVVWGDGQRTDRQIISTTEMPQFGRHHFEIPFDSTGKKWVRFAAWDTAGNGVLGQPMKLSGGARAGAN